MPQLFIKEFADKYNKDNAISKVLVEIVDNGGYRQDSTNGCWISKWEIKLNEKNEIFILTSEVVEERYSTYSSDNPNTESVKDYWVKNVVKEEFKQEEKSTYSQASNKEERIFNSSIMEQKTLEEAAQSYLHKVADGKRPTGYADEDFIAGAKWQVEQKPTYTEKEVKDFLELLHFHGYINYDITKLNDLIEYLKQ
jgi:hypothetical protein